MLVSKSVPGAVVGRGQRASVSCVLRQPLEGRAGRCRASGSDSESGGLEHSSAYQAPVGKPIVGAPPQPPASNGGWSVPEGWNTAAPPNESWSRPEAQPTQPSTGGWSVPEGWNTAAPPSESWSRPEAQPSLEAFSSVELAIQQSYSDPQQQQGGRSDWREVAGAWILYPPSSSPPEAVVHFVGGAFVGAAPQISYRLFLEALANRNLLIICTPYGTTFEHLRVADDCQYKFEAAVRALGPEVSALPSYGVGHALGSVIHLLISSRHMVSRAGNIMLSYNNRPATDVIPFLSPLIAPGARFVGPLITQLASSPVRSTVESVIEAMRGFSPSMVREVAPILEQLAPMFLDVAQGRQEFTPSPDETNSMVRSFYNVGRNLLIRFDADEIDDTNSLAQLLESSETMSSSLDLSVRSLPGDHLRPLQMGNIVALPPDVAWLASQAAVTGGGWIGQMAAAAGAFVPQASQPLQDMSKSVSGMAGFFGAEASGPAVNQEMQELADEVCAWMAPGNGDSEMGSEAKSLPTSRPM